MSDQHRLEHEIKELIIEALGLDSVDALELGLAIQKTYGIKIDADAKDTRNHFTNVASLAAFVTARQAA